MRTTALRWLRFVPAVLPAALVVFALTGPVTAQAAPPNSSEEDVTGDVFVCDSGEYTITSGTVRFMEQETVTPSGNVNATFHGVPHNVIAEDDEGNEYRIVGALSGTFHINGRTGQEHGNFRARINIVGPGGIVGVVDLHEQFLPTGEVRITDRSTCLLPEDGEEE